MDSMENSSRLVGKLLNSTTWRLYNASPTSTLGIYIG
jgi:hypothetical protein